MESDNSGSDLDEHEEEGETSQNNENTDPDEQKYDNLDEIRKLIDFNSEEWAHQQWKYGRQNAKVFRQITRNGLPTNLLVCAICLKDGVPDLIIRKKIQTGMIAYDF